MNNEQNMTQNSNQTTQAAAEQTAAEQAAVEQKLAKKKLTRRIFIGGGLGALAVVGGGAGWAYNRYLAEHTEIEDTTAYEAAAAQANASASGSATASPSELTGVKIDGQSLVNEGVWNTLSFGPALVKDSAIVDGIDSVEVDTNFGNHSIQGNQPRTGVGVLGANHLVFIVVDGRSTNYSRGVTMTEFAQMFKDLGCVSAYNLDGGGSSAMVFNNQLVNRPQGGTKERGTSDILYIAGSAS